MVMQVAADSGQIVHRRDSNGAKFGGIADTRAKKNCRRAVGPRGYDHTAGFEADRAVAPGYDDGVHSSRPDFEAIAGRLANHCQVRSLADRIEISERGVPADAAHDIHGTRRHPEVLIEIVEVSDARDSCGGCGI